MLRSKGAKIAWDNEKLKNSLSKLLEHSTVVRVQTEKMTTSRAKIALQLTCLISRYEIHIREKCNGLMLVNVVFNSSIFF